MALSKRYGIERGWPLGPGQYVAIPTSGDIPINAVLSSLSNGYVRNSSGGYVLRSFT